MKMTKIYQLLLTAAVLPLLTACSAEAPYSTDSDAKIDVELRQVSAGYAEVNFTPDRDVYYLIAGEEVREGVNPYDDEQQFKDSALFRAAIQYEDWVQSLRDQGIPAHQIAPFQSHWLYYGKTNHFVYFLKPDTRYWIYAFTVDPVKQTAVSKLFLKQFHTLAISPVTCYFQYRVRDTWDYVYPLDSTATSILTAFPYAAITLDSLAVRRYCAERGFDSPTEFFFDSIQRVLDSAPADYRILRGVYAHNNDGFGDGTSLTYFEDGLTYYTAFVGADGGVFPGMQQSAVYRFRWTPDIDTVFPLSASLKYNEW